MLLQVHDELIFEVAVDEIDLMKTTVEDLMPSALGLKIPLKVDIRMGPTWGNLE